MSKRLLNIADDAGAKAKKLGATDWDITIEGHDGVSATVRDGEVVDLKIPNQLSMSMRVFIGDRHAVVTTTDLRKASLKRLIADVVDMAKATEADPFTGLPDKVDLAKRVPNLDLFDKNVPKLTADEAIRLALDTEDVARAHDKRASKSGGTSCGAYKGETVYANSRGFAKSYDETVMNLTCIMVATQGEEMQRGYWGEARRHRSDMPSIDMIGKKAAESAVRFLGARKVPSQVVTVVTDPDVSESLVANLVGAADANHLYLQTSFLRSKEGQQVARENVNIVDNAHLLRGLGSAPFTGDGVKTGLRTIVENGMLNCMLTDTYAARKLGRKPNGGGSHNLTLTPGNHFLEEMIASVDKGLFLVDLKGNGLNLVNGNWSVGAAGIWIEKGKLTYPVSEITVAGNLLEMFQNVEAIGNNPSTGRVSAPSLKISGISIGGTND